jgi:hypothetical protein
MMLPIALAFPNAMVPRKLQFYAAVAAQLQLPSSLLTVKRFGLAERSALILIQYPPA